MPGVYIRGLYGLHTAFFIACAVKSLYTGFSCEYGADTGRHLAA